MKSVSTWTNEILNGKELVARLLCILSLFFSSQIHANSRTYAKAKTDLYEKKLILEAENKKFITNCFSCRKYLRRTVKVLSPLGIVQNKFRYEVSLVREDKIVILESIHKYKVNFYTEAIFLKRRKRIRLNGQKNLVLLVSETSPLKEGLDKASLEIDLELTRLEKEYRDLYANLNKELCLINPKIDFPCFEYGHYLTSLKIYKEAKQFYSMACERGLKKSCSLAN